MTARSGNISVGVLLALWMACSWPSTSAAQWGGPGGSLGGYGANAGSGSGMDGGGLIIPYGGRTEGFMPGRMGGGASLSFRPRPSTGMNAPRPSSRLSTTTLVMTSKPGGLRPMSGGMGQGIGPGSFLSNPMGSRGAASGVMPPTIGYPFRQPPSLLSPTSGGAGISM